MPVDIGPRIGIDGEAEFRKELNRIIQQARTLDSEMKAVSSSFDDTTDAQDKLEAQTKTLNKQIDNQSQRVEMLEKALDEARKTFGDNATQTLRWEQALNDARTSLNGMRSRLSSLGNEVKDVGDSFDDAADDALDFGDVLSANLISDSIINGIQSLASGIADLAEQTKEYRRIMASLEVSSERAGYSAEETAETYRQLYGVLEDEQSAATTTANLQALGLAQEDLVDVTNAAIGAWATYGDSLPIDGLAESINETIRAGQVTGNFADVLNWGAREGETFGVMLKENTEENKEWNQAVEDAVSAEDYFNLALQECETQAERTNLVLQLLADRGLADAGEAWRDNNKDLVEANEAVADYQDTLARASRKLSPIANTMQKSFNEIADAALSIVDDVDVDEIADDIEDVADMVKDDVLPAVKSVVNFVVKNGDAILGIITAIGAGVAAWKITTVIGGAVTAIQSFATAAQAANGVMALLNATMAANPVGAVALAVGVLVTAIGALVAVTQEEDEEHKAVTEALEARQSAMQELASAYESTKESAFGAAAAETAQLDNALALWQELQSLADAQGRVNDADRARAEFIANELSEAIGTEVELIDGQIQNYEKLRESIEDVIEAKRAQIMLDAQEEVYSEALTQMSEAQANFAQSYAAFTEAQERFKQAWPQYADAGLDAIYRVTGAMEKIPQSWIADSFIEDVNQLKNLQTEYESYAQQIGQYNSDIQRYEQAATLMLQGETEKVSDLLAQQNEAFLTAADTVGMSTQEQQIALQTQYDQSMAALEDYCEKYTAGVEGYTADGLAILQQYADDARVEAEKAGVNLVEGTERGIESKEGDLKQTTKNVFGRVVDWVKDLFNINSPSKVFEEIGEQNGAGFEIGMVDSMHQAMRNMQTSLSADLNGLSRAPMAVPVSTQMPLAGHASNNSVSYGGFTINVYAAEGMDENALADAVMDRIQTQVAQKEAVFA